MITTHALASQANQAFSPSSSSPPPSVSLLRQELDDEVVSMFDNDLKELPVSISRDKGNIQVRIRWEDGDARRMLTFCEAQKVNLHPDDFREFLKDFSTQFPQVNAMAEEIIDLEQDDDGIRQGVKTFLKFPFPLTKRIMFHWKYLQLDRNPDEHMLILSERDSAGLLKRHQTKQEAKKFVLARTFLCAFRVKPIRQGDVVVGSTVQYMFSGDTGGNIPQFIQNAVGPKTAYDSVHGLIQYVRQKKTRKERLDSAIPVCIS